MQDIIVVTSSFQGKAEDLCSGLLTAPATCLQAGCFPWQQERTPKWMSACRDHLTQDWHKGLRCAQHWVLFSPHASCSMPRRVPAHQQDLCNRSALPVLMIFHPWSCFVPPSAPVGVVTGTCSSQHAALLPFSAGEAQLCPGSVLHRNVTAASVLGC